jgi:hypothetical protein
LHEVASQARRLSWSRGRCSEMTSPGFTAELSVQGSASSRRRPSQSWATSKSDLVAALIGEPGDPGVSGKRCGPCSSTGWRSCHETEDTTSVGPAFTEACTSCGSCEPNSALPGQPFQQSCMRGGKPLTQPCRYCTKIVTYTWFLPVQCVRVCKYGLDPSTWVGEHC